MAAAAIGTLLIGAPAERRGPAHADRPARRHPCVGGRQRDEPPAGAAALRYGLLPGPGGARHRHLRRRRRLDRADPAFPDAAGTPQTSTTHYAHFSNGAWTLANGGTLYAAGADNTDAGPLGYAESSTG
jgi:hypothetical protein